MWVWVWDWFCYGCFTMYPWAFCFSQHFFYFVTSNFFLIQSDYNDITGSIPTEFGGLTSLTYLDLGKIHFFWYCVPMIRCWLIIDNTIIWYCLLSISWNLICPQYTKNLLIESDGNTIDGKIPTEIGELTALTQLQLGECECCVDVVDAPLSLFCLSHIPFLSHCGSF